MFVVVYVEWYGICDLVVYSVVEICVHYGGVYVFKFVLICMLFMMLGFVLIYVVKSVLLYVVCFLRLGVVCCVVI